MKSLLYRVTGQHPIDVAAGYFHPGSADVSLTVAEASHLVAAGAVTPMPVPAMVADANAGTSGLAETTTPTRGRKAE